MPLPINFNTRDVHGKYTGLDGNPISGSITFICPVLLTDSAEDVFVVPVPLTIELDANGEFTKALPCTDDTDLNPTNWRYTVKETFNQGGGRTFSLEVPQGVGTIELADLTELPSNLPVYTSEFVKSVNGEQGDIEITSFDLAGWDTIAGVYRVPETIDSSGVLNVTTELNSWLGGLPSGARAVFKTGGTYRIGVPGLALTKPVWFDGNGAKFVSLSGTGAGAFPCIAIQSSNVKVTNCELIGPDGSVYAANHAGSGIYLLSPSWNARYTNIEIRNNIIREFGMSGIWIEWTQYVEVTNNRFFENCYSNCHYLSVWDFKYNNNWGDDPARYGHIIRPISATDVTYGFAATRWSPYSIASAPRSKNGEIANNYQKNLYWEALDTHAGQNLSFHDNKTEGWTGIAIVSCPNEANVDSYAPLFCDVKNNFHDSGFNDGSCSYGITFAGAESGTPGTIVELATGSIIGNTIYRAGNSEQKQGATYIHDTKGLRIKDNQVIECATDGIQLYHDNYFANVSDNFFEELWSNAPTTPFTGAVRARGSYNTFKVEGNQYRASGVKAGSTVVNQRGLYIASTTGVSVVKGWNDFAACNIPYSPSTSSVYVGMYV